MCPAAETPGVRSIDHGEDNALLGAGVGASGPSREGARRVFVDQLRLTSSGKVSRNELRSKLKAFLATSWLL